MKVTTIDLIRHGEPVGGVKFRGHTDDPLSETGEKQMWDAVRHAPAWSQVVASPLLRCAQFAEALGRRLQIPFAFEPRFKEMSFGEWEGQTPAELLERDPQVLRRFYQDPLGFPPPGGEDLNRFAERVMAGWHELTETFTGGHVLLVGHGAVIRVILSHALGMPLNHLFRIDVGYAAVSRVSLYDGYPRLAFHAGRLAVDGGNG